MTVFENQVNRIQLIKENTIYEMTEWEENFIRSVEAQMSKYGKELSDKQMAVIEKIEAKIDGEK